LDHGEVAGGVLLALDGRERREGGARGWRGGEVFSIDRVHLCELVEIIDVDVACNHVREIEACFFEAIEKVTHRLADLVLDALRVDASVDTGNEAGFCAAVIGISRENAGASCGTWSHILGPHSAALGEIPDGDAGELDVGAVRQTVDLDGGAPRGVTKLEMAGVDL